MLELNDIVRKLVDVGEVSIKGKPYKVKNMAMAADDSIMKLRVVLEGIEDDNRIKLDIGVSAVAYKR